MKIPEYNDPSLFEFINSTRGIPPDLRTAESKADLALWFLNFARACRVARTGVQPGEELS